MRIFVVSLIMLVIVITGCASTRLEESLGGTWRTGTPENAALGSYGIRTVTRDGIVFTENGRISTSKLKIRPSEARIVSYKSEKEAEAEISRNSVGTLGMSYSDIMKKGYKVVLTRLGNTKEIANHLSSGENGLDKQYLSLPSLRFITGVAQIFNHNQTEKANLTGRVEIDVVKNFDGTITLKGSSGEEIQLNYEDGATVAYTYARICWNPDGTISYLQEEVPNPWYLFLSNSFDCASGTFEKKPK